MGRDRLTRRLFPLFVAVNRRVSEWTGGAVGRTFRGAPVLLLRGTGRRRGRTRTTPLLDLADGETLAVACAGGAPRHPARFLNLKANRRRRCRPAASGALCTLARKARMSERSYGASQPSAAE